MPQYSYPPEPPKPVPAWGDDSWEPNLYLMRKHAADARRLAKEIREIQPRPEEAVSMLHRRLGQYGNRLLIRARQAATGLTAAISALESLAEECEKKAVITRREQIKYHHEIRVWEDRHATWVKQCEWVTRENAKGTP